METIIELKNLTKSFPVGNGVFVALKDINLTFKKGEFAGFVGPSGSGKTTLLNIIGSLDTPTKGEALVMNKQIEKLSHKQAAQLRNLHIGFIFQTYNLLPVYSVFENVEFALMLQDISASQRKKSVMEALDWVGIADKANSKPAQLSGGQCQRVAIARAMVKKPAILLADEPTGNLDSEMAKGVLTLLEEINQQGTTIIMVTHDAELALRAKRTIQVKDGRVSELDVVANIHQASA